MRYNKNITFAEGDLFELPPGNSPAIYYPINDAHSLNLKHLRSLEWHSFQIAELAEEMR